MSGYTDDEIVRSGIVSSEVLFVQKPFEPAQLARAVRDALDAIPGTQLL
jgi:FixJ family two-component response regulator